MSLISPKRPRITFQKIYCSRRAYVIGRANKKYPVISGDFVFTYGQGYVVLHHLPTDQGRIFQRIPVISIRGALITADQKTLITFNSSGLLNFYDLKISSFEMTTDSGLMLISFGATINRFWSGKSKNNEIVVCRIMVTKSTADAAGLIDVKYEGLMNNSHWINSRNCCLKTI